MKDGRFEHLPTSTPIPTDRHMGAKPATRKSTSTQTKNRYQLTVKMTNKQTAHKKWYNERKTGAQPTRHREVFGSLQRYQSQRICHISRAAIEADLTSLRLFTRHNKLPCQETCRVQVALNTNLRYSDTSVRLSCNRTVQQKVAMYKQGTCSVKKQISGSSKAMSG